MLAIRIRKGVTRTVVLIGRLAIKFPAVRNGYRLFLQGLLANLHERFWWRETGHDARLCPVVIACPLGLWLVMPRIDDISDDQLPPRELYAGLPLDYKRDNFGRLNGHFIVLRDYGS